MSTGTPQPCSRCEALPGKIEGTGRLFLWFPLRHTLSHALRLVNGHQGSAEILGGEGLMLRMDGVKAGALAQTLTERLSFEEQDGTRVLWIPGTREPGLDDFPRVVSLLRFVAASRSGWLVGLLSEKRLTSHFQPIVAAADTSSLFGHEALMRGMDGDATVSPASLLAAARAADLLFQLDLAARQSAIREAGRLGLPARIFINFAPNAVYDPAYCLRSTVATVQETGIAAERIVFEVTESEQVRDLPHLEGILAVYRRAGFQIALDDLGAGYSSLNLIHRLKPDIVKLDMDLIRGVDQDSYKAAIAEKLLELARQLGILTVAEGVETAGELDWLRNKGADCVQGYLIAPPAAAPLVP